MKILVGFIFLISFSLLSCETKTNKKEGSFAVEEKVSQPNETNPTYRDKSEEWSKELSEEQLREIFITQFLEIPLDSAVSIPRHIFRNIDENTFFSDVRKGQKMKVGEEYSEDVIFHYYDDSYDDSYFVVFQKKDKFFLMHSPEMLTKETRDLLRGDTITLHLSSKVEDNEDWVNEYITGLTLKAKGKYSDFLAKRKKENIKLIAAPVDVNLIDLESEIAYALSSSADLLIQKILESNLPIKAIATKYAFAINDDRIPNNESVSFYHTILYGEGKEKNSFVELLISNVAQDGDYLSVYVMEDAKPNSNEIRKIKRISIY